MSLIEDDEIISVADSAILAFGGPEGYMREWYDRTLAIRRDKRNTIHAGENGGIVVYIGKTYDFVITNTGGSEKYRQRVPTITLKGWIIDGRANWSDNYLAIHKPESADRPWAGARREVHPTRIVSAVEVQS